MSTKDGALIEKMLEAYYRSNLVQWHEFSLNSLQKESIRRDMRAALAVARKAILEEAAQVAETLKTLKVWLPTGGKPGEGESEHTTIHGIEIAAAIRSLFEQEHTP